MSARRLHFLILFTAAIIGAATSSVSVAAEIQQPPREVIEKVGNILGLLCDQLWAANDEFWHKGEIKRCIVTMQVITEIDPQDTEAFTDMAWLLSGEGNNDAAKATYEKAISLNPKAVDLYFDFGMHYFGLKQYDDAIKILESALPLTPSALHWKLLAHAYEHAGRYDDSVKMWLHVKEMTPDDPAVGINLPRVQELAVKSANQKPN